MSVSIQQENVFQQLSHPFAKKHRGLDQGGGAAGWSLEDSDKGETRIFHLKQVLFFFAFSSSSSFFPFFFFPRWAHVKDITTKGEWKNSDRLWRLLHLRVSLKAVKPGNNVGIFLHQRWWLFASHFSWKILFGFKVTMKCLAEGPFVAEHGQRKMEPFRWSFLGPWCPNPIKIEGTCHQWGVRPAPKHLRSGAAKQ